MEELDYNLKQLCQAAHVTERTVRFYIKEGLLAPPSGPKSLSRYNYEHLVRLQLIRQLKERFLPLREIKKRLEGKSVAELDRLLQSLGLVATSEEIFEEKKQMETTKSQIMERRVPGFTTTLLPTMPLPLNPQQSGATTSLNPNQMTAGQQVFFPNQPMQPRSGVQPPIVPSIYDQVEDEEAQSNIWEHLTVMPGVELHVETTLANKNREVLEGLMKEMRRRLRK